MGAAEPELLARLSDAAVRDLAWVMASPGLLDGSCPEVLGDAECAREVEARSGRLFELDRDPAPLLEWIASCGGSSGRLGKYFEALLGFWIRELMGARRFEAGLSLRRDRAVVGELDFVFEPAELAGAGGIAATRHWEASVKFYLCNAGTEAEARDPASYIGTMTRDRLDRKIAKLFGQQLKAAGSEPARDLLRAKGFGEPIVSSALVKGTLFYPCERDWRAHPFPPQASAGHSRGWWSRGFPERAFGGDSSWVVLPRHRWLSPFRASARGQWAPLTHVGMREYCRGHFEEHRLALMLARVRREGPFWVEEDRGVVTHTGWPGM